MHTFTTLPLSFPFRLVAAGYKVGVAKQMETAALKAASDNKSGPFARELTAFYTRTTLLGPDVEGVAQGEELPVELEGEEEGLYLLCLCEGRETGEKGGKGKERKVTLGFLVSCCQNQFVFI